MAEALSEIVIGATRGAMATRRACWVAGNEKPTKPHKPIKGMMPQRADDAGSRTAASDKTVKSTARLERITDMTRSGPKRSAARPAARFPIVLPMPKRNKTSATALPVRRVVSARKGAR